MNLAQLNRSRRKGEGALSLATATGSHRRNLAMAEFYRRILWPKIISDDCWHGHGGGYTPLDGIE